ncbi:ProQ/FINO family protein [Oryzisolibacter propanilivorax]|uniref:ProQ/FINO family protein n=1 Tax=Oryzisolibacter propanilivorax TaxID=1527607 RepID=A0A1G9QBP5_9BURK|nr:ProQ/FINO family protein [Oryzisolibacter propanilivorax]SDM07877.1 ProQ/FINO family protein [Oryzisolibacter propanilivorax]
MNDESVNAPLPPAGDAAPAAPAPAPVPAPAAADGASAPAAEGAVPAEGAASDAAAAEASAAAPAGGARRPNRRGRGRGGRPDAAGTAVPAAGAPASGVPGAARRHHPLLDQLAQWHPRLFGAQPLPLKRGIFHDLLAAHAEIDKDALKTALALHTRSTRYLTAVASGQPRHDLAGARVEAMAPEHVHHALLEVFRRRRPRDGEDLQEKLRRRIAQAYEASGLTREAYDLLVRGRDERANALLDEAFAEVAERDARAEALLRAFEASGATPEHFADMYGMDRRQVTQQLARARRLRAPAEPAAEAAAADKAPAAQATAGTTPGTDTYANADMPAAPQD